MTNRAKGWTCARSLSCSRGRGAAWRNIRGVQLGRAGNASENLTIGRPDQTPCPATSLPLFIQNAGLRVAQVFNLCLHSLKSCATTAALPPAKLFRARGPGSIVNDDVGDFPLAKIFPSDGPTGRGLPAASRPGSGPPGRAQLILPLTLPRPTGAQGRRRWRSWPSRSGPAGIGQTPTDCKPWRKRPRA
jgi:hypothetical protein